MIRRVVEASLEFRFLVVAIAAGVMLVGVWQLREMPVDAFPEFEPPRVEIQTEAPGLSAAEVESLITLNLEELVSGTAGLETVRSASVPGLSSIELIFEPGTDLMRARQLLQERLSLSYTLPNVSKPPVMLQPLSATSRVMMIGLTSEELSTIDISVLARWSITPKLLGVPGVANVAIWGQRPRQLQVYIDPEQLRAQGVSQDQIISTAGNALWVSPLSFLNASVPGTGGWIDGPNQRLTIRHELPISSPEDLAQVVVDGTTVPLEAVTQVAEGHPPLIGDALLDDGTGLLLVVEKFPGANTLEVTRGVEEALDDLRPGLSGLKIDTSIFRAATFIEAAIDNIAVALLIGGLLLVLVLAIFYLDWRAALISFVAVPLSLVAAVLVLHALGATMNLVVLAGLVVALAAIVDDAVIDVENIDRRLRQHRRDGTGGSTASVVIEASLEMRGPIVYAALVIVMTVIPVLFLGGISRSFLEPLAVAYVLAMFTSVVVAMTVTPALSFVVLSNTTRRRSETALARSLNLAYRTVLSKIVARPRPAFALAGAVVLVGLGVSALLGQSLLERRVTVPSFEERDLLVEMVGPAGTSHPEMDRIVTRATSELQSIPGVRNVGAQIGRATTGDQVVGINSSQIWVSIDPSASYGATVAAIVETIDGYPGFDGNVQPYLEGKITDVFMGTGEDIVVRIYGPDPDVLGPLADNVRRRLMDVDGLVDLHVDSQVLEPHVEIEVDLAKAERYGLKPGDVRRAAAAVFSGIEVGSLFEEQKVFGVVVWGAPEARQSLTSVRELLVETPGGGHARLGDVAEVRVAPVSTIIRHDAYSPYLDVLANVSGRGFGQVTKDVKRALQELQFPLEYHPELVEAQGGRSDSRGRVLSVSLAAAIGIFLLLQAAFGSWRLALLVFLALPSALLGAVLAAAAGSGIMSLGSLIGFLAVFAIAARTSISMIRHLQHLERDVGRAVGPELVQHGARERLVPILLAALALGLALLPLVALGHRPGMEILRPMAIVMLGGLVTSTLLTLFVLPVLYLGFDNWRARSNVGTPQEGEAR